MLFFCPKLLLVQALGWQRLRNGVPTYAIHGIWCHLQLDIDYSLYILLQFFINKGGQIGCLDIIK